MGAGGKVFLRLFGDSAFLQTGDSTVCFLYLIGREIFLKVNGNFSFGKNSYIKSLPYFFTKKYISAVTMNTDIIRNIVPHIGPKQIPANSSTGSPGNIANTT